MLAIPLIFTDSTDQIFGAAADKALTHANATTAFNHCWTAVAAKPNVTAITQIATIGGFAASINTCLKHAIDGYSFWGITIISKVGQDWGFATFAAAMGSLAVSETGTLSQFADITGTIAGSTGAKGLNLA